MTTLASHAPRHAQGRHPRRGTQRPARGRALGFFVCENDLEYELVRALGTRAVIAVIEREGELARFGTFRKQPAKRELPLDRQVWRFMWSRKVRYARLLVDALDLDRVPRPLDGVLAQV